MRKLQLTKILEFYDVPQLFLATDQFNSNIICVMINHDPNLGFIYFAVQVSDARLKEFLSGNVDLRDLYIAPEIDDGYYKVIVNNQTIKAELFNKSDINEDILPEKGYFYEEDDSLENYELITKTQQEQFTLIRLGFIDQNNSHDIDTNCLAEAISAFQHTIKSCHQRLKGKDCLLDSNLRVTTFKAASFDVEFKSASPLDLFGGSDLSDTLLKINELMSAVNYTDFKLLTRDIKGRPVSSYRNFISILEKNNLAIKYKWVSSIVDDKIISNVISRQRVKQIFDVLNSNEELSSEYVEYEGIFLASSVENGKWSLYSELLKKSITGVAEDKALLSGVTIEQKRYKIECKEIVIQDLVKLENKIILISINEISS